MGLNPPLLVKWCGRVYICYNIKWCHASWTRLWYNSCEYDSRPWRYDQAYLWPAFWWFTPAPVWNPNVNIAKLPLVTLEMFKQTTSMYVMSTITRFTSMIWGVQHYVIKFVSDLRQVGGFLRVLRFPPPIKLTATI
jgi:hypothetical protein